MAPAGLNERWQDAIDAMTVPEGKPGPEWFTKAEVMAEKGGAESMWQTRLTAWVKDGTLERTTRIINRRNVSCFRFVKQPAVGEAR